MYALHDSFSEMFRRPFGARVCSSSVTLSLFTDTECDVSLSVWTDGGTYSVETQKKKSCFDGTDGFMHTADLTMPEKPGLVWYMFRIKCGNDTLFYCGSHGKGRIEHEPVRSYKITVHLPFALPDWYKKAVCYQIFPDRFARSENLGGLLRVSSHTNNGQEVYIHDDWDEDVLSAPRRFEEYYNPCDFFCGDLKGIEENIGYLRDLGVTCIYLNPIFQSPSNHRYDTSDYMSIDGILGGDDAFFSLKSACKKAKIHIMLDGVFSHTGADSIYFNKYNHFDSCGAYQSPQSPYYEWYSFSDYPDEYKSWWGHPTLPETDEDCMSFRSHIRDCIGKWGVSWRLDVADELTDGFLYFLHDTIKKENPDSVIIGEVWEDASDKHSKGHRRPYTDGNTLDGVMNYPLRRSIIDFLTMRISAYDFVFNTKKMQESYPHDFLCGCLNMLSSHDTERIITALSCNTNDKKAQQITDFCENALTFIEKKVILAMILLFFSEGVPCIYYGDEQGMEGGKDPFCRGTFRRKDSDILRVCRLLGRLRSGDDAFFGKTDLSAYSDDILIITKRGQDTQYTAVVNRAPCRTEVCIRTKQRIFTDVLTEKRVYADDGKLYISAGGESAVILSCRISGGYKCSTVDTVPTV